MTNDPNNRLSYVLITPARNEEKYIETTIRSVITQTVLPKKWVIVSDGSTDCTDSIVKRYLEKNAWMDLVRMTEHGDRHFAAKVSAFNKGYERLNGVSYDIIGNVDADISFGKDNFEFLLNRFAENPALGVAGTAFIEGKSVAYDYRYTNIEHVSGQCQLFRRECFEEIGGYVPIKGGGIDWTAVTTARMKGWKTRTFIERTFTHHRKMGTWDSNQIKALFKHGLKDYFLGGHPLWQFFRFFYQVKKKPFIFGGLLLLSGYAWGWASGAEKPISQELIDFVRQEQLNRLKVFFRGLLLTK